MFDVVSEKDVDVFPVSTPVEEDVSAVEVLSAVDVPA